MKPDELIAQIFLWTIAILSGFVAYEFFRSVNGRLRILMIELFSAKVWVYGGAALYFLLTFYKVNTHISPSALRIMLNLPMFWVMLKLYKFIRLKKRNQQ